MVTSKFWSHIYNFNMYFFTSFGEINSNYIWNLKHNIFYNFIKFQLVLTSVTQFPNLLAIGEKYQN